MSYPKAHTPMGAKSGAWEGPTTFSESDGQLISIQDPSDDTFRILARSEHFVNYDHILVPTQSSFFDPPNWEDDSDLIPEFKFIRSVDPTSPQTFLHAVIPFLSILLKPSKLWQIFVALLVFAIRWTLVQFGFRVPVPFVATSHIQKLTPRYPVVDLQWHPRLHRLAMIHRNDVILVYDGTANAFMEGHLWCSEQRDGRRLAWRPFGGMQLAVSCRSCIVLWHLTEGRLPAKTTRSILMGVPQVIRRPGQSPPCPGPVSWCADGTLLALAAANGNAFIHNLHSDSEVNLSIRAAQLEGSPSGRYLAVCQHRQVHVYDTKDWSVKTHSFNGNVVDAKWLREEALIIGFQQNEKARFQSVDPYDDAQSRPREVETHQESEDDSGFSLGEDEFELSGKEMLSFDLRHDRMAVIFKCYRTVDRGPVSNPSGIIATAWKIYSRDDLHLTIQYYGNLEGPRYPAQAPIGRRRPDIPGPGTRARYEPICEEWMSQKPWPLFVRFARECDHGGVITVGWSNGKIQFVPLFYNKSLGWQDY